MPGAIGVTQRIAGGRFEEFSGSVSEPPVLVAGLDDIAILREAIEECGDHLCITEDAGPFTKGEVGGDDDRGPLVEPVDQSAAATLSASIL